MSFIKNISPNSLSDKELVALYKESGDMAVLGELYQRYMELVYGVCLKYYKDPERSKDSVMQIFEELVSKLKKHEVENFKRMEDCLETLSDEQKNTVKLFYLEGKCYNEIVEMTGLEWNSVRSLIQNGRRNLKNCMEKAETGLVSR